MCFALGSSITGGCSSKYYLLPSSLCEHILFSVDGKTKLVLKGQESLNHDKCQFILTHFFLQDLISDLLRWFWVFKANVHIKNKAEELSNHWQGCYC